MTSFFRSSWSAVILGILGLSIGYVMFIQNHGSAFASGKFCPMKELCLNGECTADCPGNCGKNKAS